MYVPIGHILKEVTMSNPIGWCDETINPVVGCSHCSPGCDHCYAERFAARLAKNPATAKKYAGVVDENGMWTGKLSAPDWSCFDKLPKQGSRRIFIGSMTDIFHENMSESFLTDLFCMMLAKNLCTFMLLTKRPEKMRNFIHDLRMSVIPSNIWLGVTVCNQREADEKIPILLQIPAAKRFVSIEPMLGLVDLNEHEFLCKAWSQGRPTIGIYLDWVIVGGETGPGARPMHPDWVRSLRDQCMEAGTHFYFKGWGTSNGKKAPALLDGKEWHEIPETNR